MNFISQYDPEGYSRDLKVNQLHEYDIGGESVLVEDLEGLVTLAEVESQWSD